MPQGIMKQIKIFLDQGLSIEEIITHGYRPSTVYAVNRAGKNKTTAEIHAVTLTDKRRDEITVAAPLSPPFLSEQLMQGLIAINAFLLSPLHQTQDYIDYRSPRLQELMKKDINQLKIWELLEYLNEIEGYVEDKNSRTSDEQMAEEC